jgi:hypothetical protein
VKVGVWSAVNGRWIAGTAFFNETLDCERYEQVIFRQFFPEVTEEERFHGWFQQDSSTAHTALHKLCAMSSGTEISAAVFGQHIHLTLMLVIFSSVDIFEGQSLQQQTLVGRIKENILWKLQIFLQNSFKELIRTCSPMGGMSTCEGRQHFQHLL